jgi:hypothetical protein
VKEKDLKRGKRRSTSFDLRRTVEIVLGQLRSLDLMESTAMNPEYALMGFPFN